MKNIGPNKKCIFCDPYVDIAVSITLLNENFKNYIGIAFNHTMCVYPKDCNMIFIIFF
jgi:hypothetical protein